MYSKEWHAFCDAVRDFRREQDRLIQKQKGTCVICGQPFGDHRGIRDGKALNLCPIGDGIDGISFQAKKEAK